MISSEKECFKMSAELSEDPHLQSLMEVEENAITSASDEDIPQLEEKDYKSFGETFIQMLTDKAKAARNYHQKKSESDGDMPVFDIAVAVINEQLLEAIPGVVAFTLHKMKRSHFSFARVGDKNIVFGSLERIQTVEKKLLELVQRNKEIMIEKKKKAEKKALKGFVKPFPSTPDLALIRDTPVLPDATTPDGRRTSYRLSIKPKVAYADLLKPQLNTCKGENILKDEDIKSEADMDGEEVEDESSDIPDILAGFGLKKKPVVMLESLDYGNLEKKENTENEDLQDADYDDQMNHDEEEKSNAKRKRRRKRGTCSNLKDNSDRTCDICYSTFDFPHMMEKHRSFHFDSATNRLRDTAILLHIYALDSFPKSDENLVGDLAEQVAQYRLKLGQPKDVIDVMFESGMSHRPKSQQKEESLGSNSNLPEENEDAKPPPKKRGRKSNFEKGLPVTLPKGKKVTSDAVEITDRTKDSDSKPAQKDGVHELKCPECEFVCTKKRSFLTHLRAHEKPDLYKCDRCEYTHPMRAEVMRHKRNRHAEKIFKCETCNTMHRNKTLLNMHVKLKHTQEYSVICEICGKVLNTRVLYKDHMAKHLKEGADVECVKTQIMCNLCARILPSTKSFEQHRIKFHSDEKEAVEAQRMNEGVNILSENSFQCKYCLAYTNASAREVRRHILRKHMDKQYSCDQCPAAFPLEKLLMKHIRVVHFGLEKKKCPECNKWFRNNSYLTAHIQRTHSDEKEVNQCTLCKKQFADKRSLERHGELHKPPEDRNYKFSCDQCDKKFRFFNGYNYHMLEHSGQRPFPCEICGKDFRARNVLENHMTTHNEERNHSCIHCNKTFKLKKYLDAHLLSHTENKIQCSLCWKAFGSEEGMNRHICKAMVVDQLVIPATGESATVLSDETHVEMVNITSDPGITLDNHHLLASIAEDQNLTGEKTAVFTFMCANCGEGFMEEEEASDHKCPDLNYENDADTGENSDLRGDVHQAISDHHQYAAVSVESVGMKSDDNITTEVSKSEPSEQDITSNVDEAIMKTLTDVPESREEPAQVPVEMYMCGLCNSLFVSQDDVQRHLQDHTGQATDQVHTEILNPQQADAVLSLNQIHHS